MKNNFNGNTHCGFEFKFDDGKTNLLGSTAKKTATIWIVLGGPIFGIGVNDPFIKRESDLSHLSFVIGDECTPKLFESGKLGLSLDMVKELRFYW